MSARNASLDELLEMAQAADPESTISIVISAGLLAAMITAFAQQGVSAVPDASRTLQ